MTMPVRTLLPVAALLVASLLAGCVETSRTGGDDLPGATFQDIPEYGASFEQVTLHDTITPGESKTWEMRVVNGAPEGENEFEYRDGCGNPWTIALTDDGGNEVDWDGDVMQCQGFEERTFVGGETIPFSWTWDGRVGNDRADAEPGSYTLTVTFEGMHNGVHPTEVQGVTTFHVV